MDRVTGVAPGAPLTLERWVAEGRGRVGAYTSRGIVPTWLNPCPSDPNKGMPLPPVNRDTPVVQKVDER